MPRPDASGPALDASPYVSDDEHPKEACGVFGMYWPGQPVVTLIADALHALQHRGQEAAGLAVSDESNVVVVKDVGLVTDVLHRRVIDGIRGDRGIGHTRYSTAGGGTWDNAQPCLRAAPDYHFALAHNGNLTNTSALLSELSESGTGAPPRPRGKAIAPTSDSDVIASLLLRAITRDPSRAVGLEEALVECLPALDGAFSLVLMDEIRLFAVRDPNGFRPLCLGRVGDGWAVASESAALNAVGAEFVREVLPGEMVVVEPGREPRSVRPFPESRIDPRLCIFEFVYLARPDSRLFGREIHGARVRMGELLARKAPVDADLVMGVPDSGLPSAEGFAQASGIPFASGLVKNRYIGRTFINPSQGERERNARRKLHVLAEQVRGKRLVVVEDSVVRGTTSRYLATMLREAGAREIHFRVALPPVKWPCFYGIDIGTRQELLGALMDQEGIRTLLGADTLAFLTVEELREATGVLTESFCTACMTGDYPTEVPILDLVRAERAASGEAAAVGPTTTGGQGRGTRSPSVATSSSPS